MELNQVLVVYKQAPENPLHVATLNRVYETLKELGIYFDAQSTRQLTPIEGYDLVITVGGDGTVLKASHYVNSTPVLGVKSFGRESVGYFCAAVKETVKTYLQEIMSGKRKPIELHRLQVAIDGKILNEVALNDVLFTNVLPASTSKYVIEVGSKKEEQKSSGVWISTAAGSTAAIKAAGGKVLKLTSDLMQFKVREPYTFNGGYKIDGGVLKPSAKIKITSLVMQGTLFIDGGSTQYPVPRSSQIVVSSAEKPLQVFWK